MRSFWCLWVGLVMVSFGPRLSAVAGVPAVQTGIDVLVTDGFRPLAGKRVGLVTNPTGVTFDLRSTADVLNKAPNVKLVALFGPEHGIRGDVFAGDRVADSVDTATGVPVYSLYGKTHKPTPDMLKGIDVLVYDIQDIGSRSYTYISTMGIVMEAAAENHIEFMVLDRPNPLTGNRVEGRLIDEAHRKIGSNVGKYPIPYLYGLTCGELARMINEEGWLAKGVKCKLAVIPMTGWRRDMWFDQTGLPWVPTSPHVPRADVAMFYAATGIMGELQTVSEGVGYTLPFELAGAPFIKDAEALAQNLNNRRLPGVRFRPIYFKPYYIDRIKGQACGGVQIHITDREHVELTPIQFHIMDAIRELYPNENLIGDGKRLDMLSKVCGTDRIGEMLGQRRPSEEIIRFWSSDLEAYMAKRVKFLLYD
ncbi:MAG TPA: DUF1343 domain-containing protein [Phycisphaerae bacterium]|nr:DUF1343 domain-containing protein [Phycisphaerae bacterium]HRY66422.1 DUF1343 domain-containing protein [Phycisphaerae bacterium]HSA25870.1 DUF1343 domain-containing protein [Phycisphaerae bacterium]